MTKSNQKEEKIEQRQEKATGNLNYHGLNSSLEIEDNEAISAALISALNLRYSGKTNEDKLILDLQRTIDGLRLQIQGTGEANYSQTDSMQMNRLRSELFARQDSLHTVELSYLKDIEHKISRQQQQKDKEVKSTGFSWPFYGFIIFLFVMNFILNRLFKRR